MINYLTDSTFYKGQKYGWALTSRNKTTDQAEQKWVAFQMFTAGTGWGELNLRSWSKTKNKRANIGSTNMEQGIFP